MLPTSLWLLCLAVVRAQAQSQSSSTSSSSVSSSSSSSSASSTTRPVDPALSFSQTISTIPTPQSSDFTGSRYVYITYDGQTTVSTRPFVTISGSNSSSTTSSSLNTQITRTANSNSLTQLFGTIATQASTGNSSASSTTSSVQPTNTIPCNNHPEFCSRKYSNITEVCAHNAAFAIRNNAASNQIYGITTQLDDGIRMLQGQTHFENNTIWNCHTSCSLLNAGTWQSELETIVAWLQRHPYEVITILVGNSDFVSVEEYVAPIQNSGIAQYLYEPQYIPQYRDQWPTLGQMILSGKRVVLFMDYNANQTAVPYILDEFSHIWETPFSPVNQSFPCTQQRPPGLNQTKARDQYMYIANHNLNLEISLGAILGDGSDSSILIPNTAYINQTNGQYNQFGQLEAMSENCTRDWGRPPNFLLVDYYNYGDPKPGSVFEVAARANGVQYTRPCCGAPQSAGTVKKTSLAALAAALAFASLWVA